jgi:hypothetical protein
VLPLTVFALPSLAVLRAVALAVTLAAMALLAGAACRVATLPNALLAAASIFAMPAILTSGAWFGTEYPLFLATGLLLVSLLCEWRIGLAAAVALGLLSKSTFLLIGGPAIFVALITARTGRDRFAPFLSVAVGAVIAASWWVWHTAPALRFAALGRTFERAIFDGTVLGKLWVFMAEGVGGGLAIALVVLLARGLPSTVEKRRPLLIAAAASLPVLLLALFSPVFVPRHFAPALLPLAIVLAVLLDHVGPSVRIGVATLALIQGLALAAAPERLLPLVEQTDWSRLRAVIPKPTPCIAFLGSWGCLSPPEIRYGWTRSGDKASAVWLWRFENQDIDWPRVESEAMASDAVLVVPPNAARALYGPELEDNRFNAELIRRLEVSHEFVAPMPFRIGTRVPVDLLVYRRR